MVSWNSFIGSLASLSPALSTNHICTTTPMTSAQLSQAKKQQRGDASGTSHPERFSLDINQRAGRYIFLRNSDQVADVAICLGSTCYTQPAAMGLSLYRQGRCKKLLFTGGYNQRLKANEADLMAEVVRKEDIALCDILVDNTAHNTMENAHGAKRVLTGDQWTAGKQATTLAVVSIHYHSRRAYETFRHVFGNSYDIISVSYPSRYYTHHDWHQNPKGRSDVVGELIRIGAYLPGSNSETLQSLLQHLDVLNGFS